jgi:hypothetical protein
MSLRRGAGWIAITLWVSVVAAVHAWADTPVDNLSEANLTGIFVTLNTASGTNPSMSATDSGLGGVIGGVRRLTVSAVGLIPGGQEVSAKIDTAVNPPITPGLCANSSFDGFGTFELLYDGGGGGLDADLSQFSGIRILPSIVDVGVGPVPVSYKLTLVDEALNVASVGIDQMQSCFENCNELRFFFSDFSGIGLRHIRSIALSISSDSAFDAIIGPILLFGAGSTEPAPLLSPSMIAVLVSVLGVVGFAGMRRSRREG